MGGGRYNNLVGMYVKNPIPCVGISFGVDRIYTILQARRGKQPPLPNREVDVYNISMGGKDNDGLLLVQLWSCQVEDETDDKGRGQLVSIEKLS